MKRQRRDTAGARSDGTKQRDDCHRWQHLIFFVLLASSVLTSVTSEKLPRYSPSHLQANLNLSYVRSINKLPNNITPGTPLFAGTEPGQSQEQEAPETPQRQLEEYQKRKNDWANRYTSLQSLKETFGSNKNRLWGDLDAASARRLYKTLLPKALLELVQAGVQPEDLAPLAYQARVAAKQYARYRCILPATFMAILFDGFRTLRKFGRFQPLGMSYDQVFAKYEKAVMDDLEEGEINDMTDDDIAIQRICMRILESSCRTNEGVDRWILPADVSEREERDDLMKIAQTLEEDVKQLLHPVSSDEHRRKPFRKLRFIYHWIARIRRSLNLNNANE